MSCGRVTISIFGRDRLPVVQKIRLRGERAEGTVKGVAGTCLGDLVQIVIFEDHADPARVGTCGRCPPHITLQQAKFVSTLIKCDPPQGNVIGDPPGRCSVLWFPVTSHNRLQSALSPACDTRKPPEAGTGDRPALPGTLNAWWRSSACTNGRPSTTNARTAGSRSC